MRIGVSFGLGPLRVYVPLNKRRRRRPATPRRPYWTHDGCIAHHVSIDTLNRCAIKKGLPLEDARPNSY